MERDLVDHVCGALGGTLGARECTTALFAARLMQLLFTVDPEQTMARLDPIELEVLEGSVASGEFDETVRNAVAWFVDAANAWARSKEG
jgi:hypothetical protein